MKPPIAALRPRSPVSCRERQASRLPQLPWRFSSIRDSRFGKGGACEAQDPKSIRLDGNRTRAHHFQGFYDRAQREIAGICRGWSRCRARYVPVVRGGGKMHVRMLCLGPTECTDLSIRVNGADFDGPLRSPLPPEFRALARQIAAHAGMSLDPDLCISTTTMRRPNGTASDRTRPRVDRRGPSGGVGVGGDRRGFSLAASNA